jgi:long-chain acyl-CoA synthetase
MRHPAVVEAAAVAQPCPVLGERVHAFVVASDPAIDAGQLRQHCAPLLADYKLPDAITVRCEPLPRNANGKLMKRSLREAIAAAGGNGMGRSRPDA